MRANMQSVNLGNSGLKVSKIGFGKIINPTAEAYEQNKKMVQRCLEFGINHFDTAEIYEKGKCEQALGQILKDLKVERQSIIIATKIENGRDAELNSTRTLNKKHVKEGLKASIQRMQLEYVDIVYAHFYDENTPLEQVCRSFHEVIEEGLAFYWGVSNWDADSVFGAFEICEKYNLHKPICAQLEYNMLTRSQVEDEYLRLFKNYKLGLISWGSVAGGFLSGKHLNGISEEPGNKLKSEYYKNLYFVPFNNEKTIRAVSQVKELVENELKCSLVVASLAWCLKYKYLSAGLIGARKLEQLEEMLQVFEVVERLTLEIEGRINKILDTAPQARMNFLNWTKYQSQRPIEKA